MVKLHGYNVSQKEIGRHKCIDCGVNVIKIGDYCMLNPDLWKRQLGLSWNDNLCIACVETRLRRKLKLSDFGSFPRVEGFPMSDILADRLGVGVKRKRGETRLRGLNAL
jgi:hypothetical protein